MPPPPAWPADTMPALLDYYGPLDLGADGKPTAAWERDKLVRMQLPYPMVLSWDPARSVRRITCHRLVAESLKRVLGALLDRAGNLAGVQAARLDRFGGCYEFRRIAGSSRLSVHSFGAAIDLDPEQNPLGTSYDAAGRMIPMWAVECFRAEGWRWGGDFATRPDCMHFQATR